MHKLVQAISTAKSINELFKAVSDGLALTRHALSGMLYLLDPSTSQLWSYLNGEKLVSAPSLLGLVGQVVQKKDSVHVSSFTNHSMYHPAIDQNVLTLNQYSIGASENVPDRRINDGTTSMFGIPVRDVNGTIYGVIQIVQKGAPNRVAPQGIFLSAIAACQVATILIEVLASTKGESFLLEPNSPSMQKALSAKTLQKLFRRQRNMTESYHQLRQEYEQYYEKQQRNGVSNENDGDRSNMRSQGSDRRLILKLKRRKRYCYYCVSDSLWSSVGSASPGNQGNCSSSKSS